MTIEELKRRDERADDIKYYAKQGFKIAGALMLLTYVYKDFTKHKVQKAKTGK